MTYWRSHQCDQRTSFPAADRYFEGAVTLPLYPGMRESEAEDVVSVLREAIG